MMEDKLDKMLQMMEKILHRQEVILRKLDDLPSKNPKCPVCGSDQNPHLCGGYSSCDSQH
jgi:hypothetical protein